MTTNPSARTAQTQAPSTQPAPSQGPPTALAEARDLYRKGDFDAAIGKYQQILHEHSQSPDAYAGLIRTYLKKKDVQQASDTTTEALKTNDSAPVRVALGEVYFRQGKIHEAEEEWIKLVNAGRQDSRAYMGLARVRWAVSMYKSAWAMIEKAHALDPSDPEIRRLWVGKLSRAERIR